MEICLSCTVVKSTVERKDLKLASTIFPESNSEEEMLTRLEHVHYAANSKKDATSF